MDDREAHIRREIEDTRAAMTEKIGMIQERLEETVDETGSTVVKVMNTVLGQVKRVQDMIEKGTSVVDDTIEQVQATANKTITEGTPGIALIADIYRRPWVMMGTAVLIGYILGVAGRSSSARSLPNAGSVPDSGSDRPTTYNPTGHPFISPASSVVKSVPAPSPAQATDPSRPPSRRP